MLKDHYTFILRQITSFGLATQGSDLGAPQIIEVIHSAIEYLRFWLMFTNNGHIPNIKSHAHDVILFLRKLFEKSRANSSTVIV